MKKSIVTNFVKFRKKIFTRRKGIVSFVVAITLWLTASLPVFAGGGFLMMQKVNQRPILMYLLGLIVG